MKKVISVALMLVLVFSLVACGESNTKSQETNKEVTTEAVDVTQDSSKTIANESESLEKDGKVTIGYSTYTLANEYFSAVLDGIKKQCDEYGYDLVYYDAQNDPTKQATQIEDMIASGISGLVYIPFDSAGARAVLQTCKDAGIKVINIDNVITESEYELVDGLVASDNIQLGDLSGQWVAENYPDGANILICHLQTAEACVLNVEGFWKGIKENSSNPEKYVEVDVVEGGGATDITFNVVTDALQAHDDIDVIYCINDTSALGAVQAVEDAGLSDKISIIGKDGAPIGKQAISEKKMVQSSAQRPTYMGELGVEQIHKLLNNEEIEFNTVIDAYSITQENISDYNLDTWE